ncbi:MAG TPA: tetratricopeptide repeat protein [Mycobacterium sp.]|nr:tetratricopeptide repeat protein [Mycobacterium sp.]
MAGRLALIIEAITEFERLLTEQQRVLGADHPDTLATRNNLAFWRGEGGDVAGAITEFERLLTDRIRVLGADHPDTLATRNNLAFWRGRGGHVADDPSV